jgi:hypothetical protein
VDGNRVTSIFDITMLNKVLIAGREKYNLIPLKVSGIDIYDNKQAESKGVISTIKHAWVAWLGKNSIPLDGEFRDVKLANKTAKMHVKRNEKQMNLSFSDLNNNAIMNEPANSSHTSMNDEDILAKIIEKTIDSQYESKFEKQFYDSLKPADSNQSFQGKYWYSNRGVKLPGKDIRAKKPRFISFKLKVMEDKFEDEKPLLENSILTDEIGREELKLQNFRTTKRGLTKIQETMVNKNRNNKSFNSKNKSVSRSRVVHDNQPKNPTSLELFKKICDSYGLTRRQVFEIHSQFKSMSVPLDK